MPEYLHKYGSDKTRISTLSKQWQSDVFNTSIKMFHLYLPYLIVPTKSYQELQQTVYHKNAK